MISGWRGRAHLVLYGVSLAGLVVRIALATRQGAGDLVPVYGAVVAFLHDQPPYAVHLFVYPPSVLVLMLPVGIIPFATAKIIFICIDAPAIWIAGLGCLRLVGLGLRTLRAAGFMAIIALLAPVAQTLDAADVNGLILLAEVGFLLVLARNRGILAGACLGLSLAIKPVLLALGLILLLRRKWPGALVAAAIPIGLSLLVTIAVANPLDFVRTTIPFLLGGEGGGAGENVSIAGTVVRLGLPMAFGVALRVIAGAAGIALVWLLRRETNSVPFAAVLIATTFLTAPFSWPYYGIYLLPLLAYAIAGGANWNWLGVAALYCLAAPDLALWLRLGRPGFDYVHIRVTLGFALALGAIWMTSRSDSQARESTQFASAR